MKILGILTIDCRTPDRQIGKKVGLSGVAVKYRIIKMVRSGVIQNFTMKVEPPSLGYGIIYLVVPSDDESALVKKLKLVGEPFFVVPCLGDITACGIVVEKDVEQKTELVKNLISNARIVLTLDAKESEFRADLTKTDFKILDQLLKNPREKIDSISKSIMLSTKTVTRAIEKFEKNPAIQFTVIYDPRKLGKFIAFAVLAMVQSNIKKVKKEIETSFGDYFWQVPFAAKELLVLFMYSENLYDADTMHHKIKEIDGVAFTEVFFPKKIMMPTNWISRSAQNAARSEKFHSFSENRWAFDTSTLENLDETRWDLFLDPTNEKPISAYQLHYLKILNYDGSPPKTKGEASQLIADLRYHWKDKEPTQEQKSYLKKLGYKGLPPKHRGDASNLISKLLYQKGDKITEDIIPYLIYGESKTTKRSWRDSLD